VPSVEKKLATSEPLTGSRRATFGLMARSASKIPFESKKTRARLGCSGMANCEAFSGAMVMRLTPSCPTVWLAEVVTLNCMFEARDQRERARRAARITCAPVACTYEGGLPSEVESATVTVVVGHLICCVAAAFEYCKVYARAGAACASRSAASSKSAVGRVEVGRMNPS
jgi:hypothetical protein